MMSVKTELINKTFKLIEINIPELKVLKNVEISKRYNSRVQQRLNKKKGYNSSSGFQKEPDKNYSYKKKGLGFIPPETVKMRKILKQKQILCQVKAQKRNRRNRSVDSQIKSFLLKGRKMELKYFIKERLEPVTSAMKLVTLHGTVRKMPKKNREFLRK
ncbi:hypothetical protein Hanom_Chr00s000007g01615311 [Helianthus anomalus]